MADEEKAAAPDTNIVSFVIAGERYDIDLFDIDGCEWRDMKRVTGGMTSNQIVQGALVGDDVEAVAALVWIWRRREVAKLKFESVLRSFKLRDFGDLTESEEPPNPPD